MVFVIVLVVLILFLVLAKLGMAYAAGLTQRMVTETLQDVESIVNQRSVPHRWVRHIEWRIYGPSPVSFLEAKLRRADRDSRAKQALMARLDSLARYLQSSPFMEDDPATRKVVAAEFRRARTEWEALDWSQLAGLAATGSTHDR